MGGVRWREAIRYVNDENGPQDKFVIYLFAKRLLQNGFADLFAKRLLQNGFADRFIEYIYSLGHVDTQEMGLFLDSTTYDFLIVCWITDDGGRAYRRTMANELHADSAIHIKRDTAGELLFCHIFKLLYVLVGLLTVTTIRCTSGY